MILQIISRNLGLDTLPLKLTAFTKLLTMYAFRGLRDSSKFYQLLKLCTKENGVLGLNGAFCKDGKGLHYIFSKCSGE